MLPFYLTYEVSFVLRTRVVHCNALLFVIINMSKNDKKSNVTCEKLLIKAGMFLSTIRTHIKYTRIPYRDGLTQRECK